MAESVCKLLEEQGHYVTRLRDVIPMDSPDPMVAKMAQERNEILITDDGDFGVIVSPKRKGKGKRFKKLSRITMKCDHAISATRMAAALSLIVFEYDLAQAQAEKRIIIEINHSLIRLLR